MADFTLRDEGSIYLLTPMTPAAIEWADAHIFAGNDEVQTWCGAIVIEPRYVADIIIGIGADELEWESA